MRLRVIKADASKASTKMRKQLPNVNSMVTLAAREDTKPYVPYETGELRRSAEIESIPERGLLVYGSNAVPYARAQYYGYPNKRWPGTYSQWFEHSKAANKHKWTQIAERTAKGAFR